MTEVVENTVTLGRAASSGADRTGSPPRKFSRSPELPAPPWPAPASSSSNLRGRRCSNAKPLRVATHEGLFHAPQAAAAAAPAGVPAAQTAAAAAASGTPACPAAVAAASVASAPPLPAAYQRSGLCTPRPAAQTPSLPTLQPFPPPPYSLPPPYSYRLPPPLRPLPPPPLLPALQPSLAAITNGQNLRKLPGILPLPSSATSALLLPAATAALPVPPPFAIQFPVAGPPPKQKRRRRSPEEFAELMATFEKNPKPCRQVREQLSRTLNMSIREVQIWFQNQRAKLSRQSRAAGADGGLTRADGGLTPPATERKERKGGGKAPRPSAAPRPRPYPAPMLPQAPPTFALRPLPATFAKFSPGTPVSTSSMMTFYSISAAALPRVAPHGQFLCQPSDPATPITASFIYESASSPNRAGATPTPRPDVHLSRTPPLKPEGPAARPATQRPSSCGTAAPRVFSYTNATSPAEAKAATAAPSLFKYEAALVAPSSAPPWGQRSGTPPREASHPASGNVPLAVLTPPPTASPSFSPGEAEPKPAPSPTPMPTPRPQPPQRATEEEGRTFADAMALLIRAAEMAEEADALKRRKGRAASSKEGGALEAAERTLRRPRRKGADAAAARRGSNGGDFRGGRPPAPAAAVASMSPPASAPAAIPSHSCRRITVASVCHQEEQCSG